MHWASFVVHTTELSTLTLTQWNGLKRCQKHTIQTSKNSCKLANGRPEHQQECPLPDSQTLTDSTPTHYICFSSYNREITKILNRSISYVHPKFRHQMSSYNRVTVITFFFYVNNLCVMFLLT